MGQQPNSTANANGVRSAAMPKHAGTSSRASLAELIKRTNQTAVRITAKD
jgi:hypothetical protein